MHPSLIIAFLLMIVIVAPSLSVMTVLGLRVSPNTLLWCSLRPEWK